MTVCWPLGWSSHSSNSWASRKSYLAVEQIIFREVTPCINYSISLVLRDVNSKYLRCEVCDILWELKVSLLHGKVYSALKNRIPLDMEALSPSKPAAVQWLQPRSDHNPVLVALHSTKYLDWLFFVCFMHHIYVSVILNLLQFLNWDFSFLPSDLWHAVLSFWNSVLAFPCLTPLIL